MLNPYILVGASLFIGLIYFFLNIDSVRYGLSRMIPVPWYRNLITALLFSSFAFIIIGIATNQ